MRSGLLAAGCLLLSIGVAGLAATTPARAEDGTITVEVREAIALTKFQDGNFNPEQDFEVGYTLENLFALAPEISSRDHAAWAPPSTLSLTVPGKNQRFFNLQFLLEDNDPFNNKEPFDISPVDAPGSAGMAPQVVYDVCTGRMTVQGAPNWVAYNSATITGAGQPGVPDHLASLVFAVKRQPENWLPDDIAVVRVLPVQSIYEPSAIVSGKPTSLAVDIASTYPTARNVNVTATMGDGATQVTKSGFFQIDPGINRIIFFAGFYSDPPFVPLKPIGIDRATLSATATVASNDSLSPNAPPALADCPNFNNTGRSTDLPIVRTKDPKVVYRPFDWDFIGQFAAPGDLQTMLDREENFRLASWPIATANGGLSPVPLTLSFGFDYSPENAISQGSTLAMAAQIDRLVMAVEPGWFGTRHGKMNTTGMSLSENAPHAVLADVAATGVVAHEIGHTYRLSQHKCSNGGIKEGLFNRGCRDEYQHLPADGAPYMGNGFDVQGLVYPSGWLVPPCAPGIVREVCAPNMMWFSASGTVQNWIDNMTFTWLVDALKEGSDPRLLNVTGLVRAPDGLGDGSTAPVFEAELTSPSYQFDGVPDIPEAPVTSSGDAWSGVGQFKLRLELEPGLFQEYRFTPVFEVEGEETLTVPFALGLPLPASLTAIEVWGPVDIRETGCENAYCPWNDRLLFRRDASAAAPSIANLRAGLNDVPPAPLPGEPPPIPTIGPGQSAVLGWDIGDPDSADVRALILIGRVDPAGGSGTEPEWIPLAIDRTGTTFTIPHDLLAAQPGPYVARVLVSDGVNANAMTSGIAFNICNFANGGVEICNGIDDDCNGIVDDAVAPGAMIMLNPQPQPPGIAWTPIAGAESYDVVYGDVGALRASAAGGAGGFGAATLGCLASRTTATSVGFDANPAIGQGFWFLARAVNCAGPGSYDSGGAGQVAPRDPAIASSAAACP